MSIIEKSCAQTGIELVGDSLPKEHRKVKSFQRLIAAMRAAEAEVLDKLSAADLRTNEVLQQLLELQDENHRLREQVRKYEFATMLASVDVPTEVKQQLLGVETVAAAV